MDTERKPSFNLNIFRSSKQGRRISNKRKAKWTATYAKERDALKDQSKRTEVLITNTDKGGAVLIWGTKDFINEANRQLNVTSTYKKLPSDPTVIHSKLITDAINRF